MIVKITPEGKWIFPEDPNITHLRDLVITNLNKNDKDGVPEGEITQMRKIDEITRLHGKGF